MRGSEIKDGGSFKDSSRRDHWCMRISTRVLSLELKWDLIEIQLTRISDLWDT